MGAFTPWCLQVAACIAMNLVFDFKAATELLASRKRRGEKGKHDIDLSAAQPKLEDCVLSIPDDDDNNLDTSVCIASSKTGLAGGIEADRRVQAPALGSKSKRGTRNSNPVAAPGLSLQRLAC